MNYKILFLLTIILISCITIYLTEKRLNHLIQLEYRKKYGPFGMEKNLHLLINV